MTLEHFNLPHLCIIFGVPVGAFLLARWGYGRNRVLASIRSVLGLALGLNEAIWYFYLLSRGWVNFPFGLPLDLCDIVLWLTVYTLFSCRQWSFDLIYYCGLVGTGMALLTPDIGAPFPSYSAIKFLASHGGVVTAILFLVWSGSSRPRSGSWWKALLWLNMYAGLIGIFNLIFQTNYFYLCKKPLSGSLLDYLGPWPFYIAAGEGAAAFLFLFLWVLFSKSRMMK